MTRFALALAFCVLAGCTQTIAFKVMDVTLHDVPRPLAGVRIAHGTYTYQSDNLAATPQDAILQQWHEWDYQVTGPEGTADFKNTRRGGEFQFEKNGYAGPQAWYSSNYHSNDARDGRAYVVDMWQLSLQTAAATTSIQDMRIAQFKSILTSDSWARDMGVGGGGNESTAFIVYRFYNDGTYARTQITDHAVPVERGTWKLVEASKDEIHLLLVSELEKPLQGLTPDSIIHYNSADDTLVISGLAYPGSNILTRRKFPSTPTQPGP